MKIIKYEEKYRDDMIFMILEAKNALGRVPGLNEDLLDSEQHNDRKDIVEEYKANRIDYTDVPEEENPFSQLPYVYKALDFMKIKHTEVIGYETDDVIASYVIRYSGKISCLISSWDSDYFQLINESVNVLRYRGKKTMLCDVDFIQNKFGIAPEVYEDFKSLIC